MLFIELKKVEILNDWIVGTLTASINFGEF